MFYTSLACCEPHVKVVPGGKQQWKDRESPANTGFSRALAETFDLVRKGYFQGRGGAMSPRKWRTGRGGQNKRAPGDDSRGPKGGDQGTPTKAWPAWRLHQGFELRPRQGFLLEQPARHALDDFALLSNDAFGFRVAFVKNAADVRVDRL